jgi:fatty acid desaturase
MNEAMPLRAAEELEDSATATASDFDRIEKKSLADRRGVTLREFKAGLRPRYARVWLALLLGHAALAATLAGEMFAQVALPVWAWPGAVVLGACVIGYTLAYIQLFFHEAAHYNLARDRRRNDLFADLFIGSLIGGAFGQGVADYRIVHFDHHRYLGTTQDTERSYFKPLTGRFILEALTGIQALRVIAGYRRAERKGGSGGAPSAGGRLFNRHLARSLVLHVGIIAGAVWCRQWTAAAAWVAGVALVYPFFGAVRQVLEHRSLSARADVDYAVTDHGAVNRMFGDGLLASTLGGAGFNRHLLHHWEPQISCTRLRDLETYLLGTPAADALAAHRTSYLRTFAALLKANERSAS